MSKQDIMEKKAEIDKRQAQIKRDRKTKFRFLRNIGQRWNYYISKYRKPSVVVETKPVTDFISPEIPCWKKIINAIKAFLTKFRRKV